MSIIGMSFAGQNAAGALLQGKGLGHYGQIISGLLRGSAVYNKMVELEGEIRANVVDPEDVSYDPAADISPAVIGTLNTIGNGDAYGSGAFTGTVSSSYTSLDAGRLHDSINAWTSYLHGGDAIKCVQLFENASSVASVSRDLHPTIVESKRVNFGIDPAVEKLDFNTFNSEQFYLGEQFNNPVDMVTNGYTILVDSTSSLPQLGTMLIELGSAFNLINPTTFGNPGQLLQACYTADIAEAIGLSTALSNVGLGNVAFDDLDLDIYNNQCKQALAQLDNPTIVDVVKRMLNVTNVQITTLDDFTKFENILPNYSILNGNTLDEFRQVLIKLEYGDFVTASDFGNFLSGLSVPNMPTLGNESTPTNGNMLSSVENKYLYNGNPISLTDLIGSVGGVGISEHVLAYTSHSKTLEDSGQFVDIIQKINDAIDIVTGVTSPGPATVEEATIGALDDIANEAAALNSKKNVVPEIAAMIESYLAIGQKVVNEKQLTNKFNLYLNDRMDDDQLIVLWPTSLRNYLTDPNDMAVVEGCAECAVISADNLGEYILSACSEARNMVYIESNNIRYAGGVQA